MSLETKTQVTRTTTVGVLQHGSADQVTHTQTSSSLPSSLQSDWCKPVRGSITPYLIITTEISYWTSAFRHGLPEPFANSKLHSFYHVSSGPYSFIHECTGDTDISILSVTYHVNNSFTYCLSSLTAHLIASSMQFQSELSAQLKISKKVKYRLTHPRGVTQS